MSPEDYKKLNFKAGLEIHQQLDSKKLFCNCPSILRKDKPDFEVKRKLHAVAGESGEVDVAALYQSSLKKQFIYQGYDSTCLVELDEEPPHEINQEALLIALHISLLLNCKIVPITQIMRKTVIDGSNTSGFQRSTLIAINGFLETSQGKVRIENVYLEEDAARIIKKEKSETTYRLDRLGIPLIEIVTSPDLKSSEHAKEVALKIGEILRSCKVRRGIGTIRQDINISIKNENRVEIKGMQKMDIFEKAIENEIIRQKELSEAGNPVEMEVRKVLPDATTKYLRPLPGSSRMYPETDLPLLKISREKINQAKKTLPKSRQETESNLKKTGLTQEMINLLFKQNKLNLFEELIKISNKAELIAKMILLWPKEIAKHEKQELAQIEQILEDNYFEILSKLEKGKLPQNKIQETMKQLISGKKLSEIKFKTTDKNKIEEFILKILKEKPGLRENAYMGLVMKEFQGKVNAGEVMEIIKRELK